MSSTRAHGQLCTATPISSFFRVTFHFAYCFRQAPRLFNRNIAEVIT